MILQEVWELATSHGLLPKSVSTEKPIDMQLYVELPLKMVIVGDFDGFYGFLLDMERLRRITRLPQMRLEKSGRDNGKIQADLILSIFHETKQNSATKAKALGSTS